MKGPFHPTAHVYDVFYSFLPYDEHAASIETVIRQRAPHASTWLDVACGTGRHIEISKGRYERVVGVDIDDAMLTAARQRLPTVEFHQADMTEFDLGEQFDAVTCLFSSIGYARTEARLQSAVASMAHHVRAGGVLVIEPWLQRDVFVDGHVHAQASTVGSTAVARTSQSRLVDETVSRVHMEYLVVTPDTVDRFSEVHELGMFTPEQFVEAIERTGLLAEYLSDATPLGRGLAVGVRPS